MKVRELIASLQQHNPEALVLLDVNEDWGKAKALHTKQQVEHPEDGLYFKGDSPAYLKGIDYVMIADE